MGDPGEARKEVVTPREDCVCNICDLLRFHAYAQRITPELGQSLDDDSPRMKLIFDVHSTLGVRHPLGIAERLYEIIASLRVVEPEEDRMARQTLEDMVYDEKASLLANPDEWDIVSEDCPVAAKCNEDRSLIP